MGVGEYGVFLLGRCCILFVIDSRYQSRLVSGSERETVRERLARRMWTPWLLDLSV
jgi:hypothetical protein